MNTDRQLYNLNGLLRPKMYRTYPEPTHDPQQVADCYEDEGRLAAMKKFNLSEHWVRHFHKQFYPPKQRGGFRHGNKSETLERPLQNKNYQSTEDLIECKYSLQQIRTFYALLLAGRGKYDRLEDVPGCYRKEDYEAPIDTAVKALAGDWVRFRKKQYGKG